MNPYYERYLYNQYIADRDMPPGMPSPTPFPGPMPGPRPPMPGPWPRPPMPGPRPPIPRPPIPRPPVPRPPIPPTPPPIPVPVPVPMPGPYYRPLNVYLCKYFSAREATSYCHYTVAYADQLFPIRTECSTFVAGPFYTMRDADAYIESLGVRRGQVFEC